MRGNTTCAIGIALLLAAGSGAVRAGESYSMEGRGDNEGVNAVMPVDEGRVVVHVWSNVTLTLEDTSNPVHGATGICSGSVLVASGESEGSGLCTYEATGGGTLIVRWTNESINERGGNSGTWELIGGSGRWAEATASGTFSDTPDDAGATSTNYITGDLSFD